ncbi:MAG: serine hydrolase domain-containing protein [Terriglobales bacterium]
MSNPAGNRPKPLATPSGPSLDTAFAVLREGVAQRAFPGASAAISRCGKLVALRSVGRFTYDPSSPEVMPETVFDLASVSKVVATTTMAMLMYERGELDLEDPLFAIVPEFIFSNSNDSSRKQVTVRMLLSHSSGLPAYERLFERARNRQELIQAAAAVPLEAEPGTRALYSDIGFLLLGEALARLAGEDLDSFCRREIFGPLGMGHTMFCPPPWLREKIPPTEGDPRFRHRIVQGEVNDENAFVMGGVAGHAGVFACAADMAAFAAAMLLPASTAASGANASPPTTGRRILRPETIATFTCCSTTPGASRALGWDTPTPPSQSGKYFSPRSYGHLGFTGTSLWIDPERQLAVVLLTNRTWPDRQSQLIKRVRPRFHDAVVEALAR